MGSIFSKPKEPDLPPAPEPIEKVAVVEEDATAAQRRKKKSIVGKGRSGTIISGITSALKKRLGA